MSSVVVGPLAAWYSALFWDTGVPMTEEYRREDLCIVVFEWDKTISCTRPPFSLPLPPLYLTFDGHNPCQRLQLLFGEKINLTAGLCWNGWNVLSYKRIITIMVGGQYEVLHFVFEISSSGLFDKINFILDFQAVMPSMMTTCAAYQVRPEAHAVVFFLVCGFH